jgi:hypothetical protein
MVLQKFEDFIRLSPERTQLNSNDSSDLRWEVFAGGERCLSTGFSLKIGEGDFLMENGCIDIPEGQIRNLLVPGRPLDVKLRAENCEWILARATIRPDPLSTTEFNVRQERGEDNDCLVSEFKFSPLLSGDLDIRYDIHMVNLSSLEIETTQVILEDVMVPFEKTLVLPLHQPAGRFLGIVARIIQGDCSIEVSDSVDAFSISSESNIIPSRYWGRGTSDVSINTYRLRNSQPERVVKENVRRADLRTLVPESLGKMELHLENFSLLPIHENQTCIAKSLRVEFSCVNDDLQTLSEIEYLSEHSQFRLETSFLYGRFQDIGSLLRYNGRFLATEIQISSSELKRLFSNVKHHISIRKSDRINPYKIPINNLISHEVDFGIVLRNRNKRVIELFLEDGPLCPESIVERIEIKVLRPGGRTTSKIFCPYCGMMFSGYPPYGSGSCQTPNCDFGQPYFALEEMSHRLSSDRQTISVDTDLECNSLVLSLSHGDSHHDIEINLGGDVDVI